MKMLFVKLVYACLCLLLFCQCNSVSNEKLDHNQNGTEMTTQKLKPVQAENNLQATDRPSINIASNQVLRSPITIKVNSEGKWGGFEGELGTIKLFDSNNNIIGTCILSTIENWMVTGPVNYTCDLIYNAGSTGNGRLLVKNNNPTGQVEHDKSFEIPVRYEGN